jgi:ribosomal protein S18 acetylase RimI-like enzyme
MIIRRAEKQDANDCYKIAISEKESYWQIDDFIMSAKDNSVIFLVAHEGKNIEGYILGFIMPTKTTEALIHEVRVSPNARKKGIGTKLVEAFCKEGFERGADVILAEIESDLLNFYRGSCRFKERGKWIEVGKSKSERRKGENQAKMGEK